MLAADSSPNCPPVIVAPAKKPGRWSWLLGAGLIGGLLVYYFFNPGEYALFPGCQFFRVTGNLCPGCGGQRALHFLLHGELGLAFHHNALFVLTLPVGLWFATRLFQLWLTGRPLPGIFNHRFAPWIFFSLLICFGLLRNLPGFGWLRP